MRSSFKEPCGVLWLALLAGSCVPVPVGVGVTVPIAPAPAPVVVTGPGFEMNANRPGADYRGFDIAPHPEICRNACLGEAPCAAFTYVAPGVQGPAARCWLKSAVPPLVPDACCVSGFKPAAPPPPPPPPPPPHPAYRKFEGGFTRPGADYRTFDLPAANPEMCREICYREPRCAAFTYVHPHVVGPWARCSLKSAAPPAMPNGCCISGVK
jgi:PAN domain